MIARMIVNRVTLVMLAAVAGVAVQPLLRHPDLQPLLIMGAQVIAITLIVLNCALMVGYAHHRLQLWRALRPPLPPLASAVQFSATHERAVVEHDQAVADYQQYAPDDVRRAEAKVVKFCVIGTMRRSFAWNDCMSHHTDRGSWNALIEYLAGNGALVKGRGNKPTWWCDDWDVSRVRLGLRFGTLPSPAFHSLPDVRW